MALRAFITAYLKTYLIMKVKKSIILNLDFIKLENYNYCNIFVGS